MCLCCMLVMPWTSTHDKAYKVAKAVLFEQPSLSSLDLRSNVYERISPYDCNVVQVEVNSSKSSPFVC